MDFAAIAGLVLAVIGLAGCFLPVIPGPALSWLGLLCLYFSDKADQPVSLTALLVWLAVVLILTVLDYVLPARMTRRAGGHKAAERGAAIGMVAGMLFTPVGMVAGSFLGAFLGEYLFAVQDPVTALKAAAGTFLAFLLTTGIKAISVVILIVQMCFLIF